MGYDAKTWADIPAGHDNPLNFAVTSRDRQLIEMVTDAVKNDRVMLAYQAIVPAGAPARPALYEGLIRVMDTTGRIIPACDFIAEIEATETGRIIDCIALEQGLKAMHDYPDLRLAINMSARSIGYPRWNEILRRGLRGDPTALQVVGQSFGFMIFLLLWGPYWLRASILVGRNRFDTERSGTPASALVALLVGIMGLIVTLVHATVEKVDGGDELLSALTTAATAAALAALAAVDLRARLASDGG